MAALSPVQMAHHHRCGIPSSTPTGPMLIKIEPLRDHCDQRAQEQEQMEEGDMADKGAVSVPAANQQESQSVGGTGGYFSMQNQSQDVKGQKLQSSGSGRSFLKPKSSLLTRARNSTINLASLAQVTNKFACSASVGNIWHGVAGHNNNHTHHHHNQQSVQQQQQQHNSSVRSNELPVNAQHDDKIQPLDDVFASGLDSAQAGGASPPINSSATRQPSSCPKQPGGFKSTAGSKLLSVASCGSTRKLSTKEKNRRQKEVERVEKLRMLVSYLESGSSQPVVSPVALEADEIELAERYKSHLIVREPVLDSSPSASGQAHEYQGQHQHRHHHHQQQQQQQQQQQPALGLAASGSDLSKAHSMPSGGGGVSAEPGADGSGAAGYNTTATSTSPITSSSCSMDQAHLTGNNINTGRSIPHIGCVTRVLRHSISDPGNQFERAQNSPLAFPSPSPPGRRPITATPAHNIQHHEYPSHTVTESYLHHNHNRNNHHHHHYHHFDHQQQQQQQHDHQNYHHPLNPNPQQKLERNGSQLNEDNLSLVESSCEHQLIGAGREKQRRAGGSCANCHELSCNVSSSSYSGSSINSCCVSAPAYCAEAAAASAAASATGAYVRRPLAVAQTTMASAIVAGCVSCDNTSSSASSNPVMKSPKLFYIDDMDPFPNSPLTFNTTANNNQIVAIPTPCLLHPQAASTPTCGAPINAPSIGTSAASNTSVNTTASGGAESSSSLRDSSSGSAWTNPQNLATWIDNEVNSLVHDLEAKSQQLMSKKDSKHGKSGKRKWLSVTSNNSRRNSSGAQST